jgi:MFS transporter, ACDE family, multidrug resistance protein
MAIAAIATWVLVEPVPGPERRTGLLDPIRALRHRGLATLSLTALCYNWVFFTVLGYAPPSGRPSRSPSPGTSEPLSVARATA